MSWKDTLMSNEMVTPHRVVDAHVDIIGKMGDYTLRVRHVKAWGGKGFMGDYNSVGCYGTTKVFYGTDPDTQAAAAGELIQTVLERIRSHAGQEPPED